jgi:hypothetical protein
MTTALPTCRRMSQLVSEAEDRPLGMRERLLLVVHTLYCGSCRAFRRQIRLLRRNMRELGESLTLSSESRARIEQALRDAESS